MDVEQNTQNPPGQQPTKYCRHCGGQIPADAVVCTLCGRQVEQLNQPQAAQPQVVINNTNAKPKDKWTALLLCFFLGFLGIHKFYEGKIGMGVLYIFTLGLFGIGALIDFIVLLFKPNPYYV